MSKRKRGKKSDSKSSLDRKVISADEDVITTEEDDEPSEDILETEESTEEEEEVAESVEATGKEEVVFETESKLLTKKEKEASKPLDPSSQVLKQNK